MAHELDFTKGKAAIAYRGDTPWHGLGEHILPQDSIDDIRIKAGLDYDVIKTPVMYQRVAPLEGVGITGDTDIGEEYIAAQQRALQPIVSTSTTSCVLYRSDTGADLSVVSPKYQVVQPKEVIDFYRDLTEQFGFELEVVGALRGGRKVWALANTGNAFALHDDDKVKGYLLLATSYDGTMATQARFTSIRVVCNNTLTLAAGEGRADVTVPHSRKFNADQVKNALGIGPAWERFQAQAERMARVTISREDTLRLFMDAYYNLGSDEAIREHQAEQKSEASTEKLITRLTDSLFSSPGAQLASARGTLWGALQAVTYDVDHALPSRSSDTRLDKAWFGVGNTIKQRALERALLMAP